MDLNDIMNQWAIDCEIGNNYADASRDTPKLHAKYLQMYSTAKLLLKRAENAQKILLRDKWLYYNGKMCGDDIKARGWKDDPFDGLKVMKGDLDYYYESDPEIQASEDKIQYYRTLIDTLKEIVENLKWRHQTIGNIIKWRQFEAGA